MNVAISHVNLIDAATLTYSTQHPSFPASNVQHRWFVKPWRSRYGTGSGWGLFRVIASNRVITFGEGGGNLTANLTTGDYDTASLCTEIKTRMDAAGALTYTVTYDDATNLFTIAASGAFILVLSVTANSAFPMLGWTASVDTASLASHTAPAIRIHTEEELRFDLGAASNLYFFALKNHNFQSTATIRLIYYSDAWITQSGSDTLTWKADLIGQILNQNQRYVKLRVVDIDNPDLYLEVGRPWIGDYLRPRIGFSMERTRVKNDPSVIAESENGQESSIQRSKYSTWNYVFEGVDPDDAADIAAIFEEVGLSKPLFICEDPEVADITPYIHYIRLASWEEPHIAGDWWRLETEIKEER
jgi:hypothetical protein